MTVRNPTLALVAAFTLGATLVASGGSGSGGGGGLPGSSLSLRLSNETVPPGGLVQIKVQTTEVTPISGGRPGFGFDNMFAAGFGMFATGDLAGAAVVDNGHVAVSYITNGALTANYPLLTASFRVRPDLTPGTRTLFTMDPGALWNVLGSGPVFSTPTAPAVITIGGTASISDVVPGEGVWPAGTLVRVSGMGFSGRSQVRINDAGIKIVKIVSPNELQFTLTQTTQMRGVKITVSNPENTVTYYAYMRGLVSTVSSRTLLAATEPIFSLAPRTISTFPANTSLLANQYQAVAMQNPNATDVDVNVLLYAADGSLITQAPRTLASRERITLELLEMFAGVAPLEGSFVMVMASAPIDAIGLVCDEGTWTVTPSLPLESPR